MTVPPYAAAYVVTLLVSWSADKYNAWVLKLSESLSTIAYKSSRAIHSAVFSLIGAIGFIASATLPADSYSVSPPIPLSVSPANSSAPLWLSHHRSLWLLRLYSASSGLAVIEPTLHRCHRLSYCSQHLDGCSRTDRRCLDLQGQ